MRISTVIPAYNRADLIGETLDGVLGQSRPPSEVIVVDDGSTDGTADVVASYGRGVVLIQQANQGAGAARNAGFAHANGELIHFMDSDDIPSLNTYDVQTEAILKSGAGMAYGPWIKVRFGPGVLTPEPVVIQQRALPDTLSMDRLILRGRWITVFQPCLFRRDVVELAGPYRTDLKPSEDTEMLYRIAVALKRAVHTPESILLYRVHPESQVSASAPQSRAADWVNLCQVMLDHTRSRSDLDFGTMRMARRMLARAVLDLASIDPARTRERFGHISFEDHVLIEIERLALRVAHKLKRTVIGNPYSKAFQAGLITDRQRAEIVRLGYRLGTRDRI